MIPKNRDNSGTALLYIVGQDFVRPGFRRANGQASAAAAHDHTSRRRLQAVLGGVLGGGHSRAIMAPTPSAT